MATQSTPLTDAAWTPKEALLTDEIANEVYASQYAERKMSRFVIGTLSVLLVGSLGAIVSLAHKPIQNRYIRIDEIGRAQAIQYSDLNYSPREGEVRTYLTDWANYRYTVSRDTISKKYPLNYFFFSQQLSTQFMSEDNRNHMISQVMAGQMEQSDVEVRNVTITSMAEEQVQGVRMSRGTALVNIDKLFSVRNSHEPRTEHWMLSVTYYLNPKQVSEQSRVFPQFETINPLGMTITEFHENRIGVDPISDGTAKPRPAASTLTPSTISAPILPGTESGAIR
ncbi:VirB8/TrbF family protein [Edaphobacter modestus]|uniref:Type IV secretion system protein VirB5 n=1 Tax=Edaphobacter modestus TaxID=388466 RepID=A0A4Q7YCK1_9BACT|nr:VirB8/TrbF family protein [Edaphobacter modestus]RZU34618.1 type IV secretion system protein VirB5 [Edaphobacter modestus]